MEKIFNPENEAELALIKSLFDAEGIYYFVQNDNFGSILVGPQISNYNVKTVLVPDDSANRAREIVAELRQHDVVVDSKMRLPDRLRMVLETAVFSWFVPGRRWGKSRKSSGDAGNDAI